MIRQLAYASLPATGMRIDEFRRLTWSQVDENRCLIHFRPHRAGEATKAQRAHRAPKPEVQVIPEWLARELRRVRAAAASQRGGPVDPAGRVLLVEQHFVRYALRPDAEYAGVELENADGVLDAHALGRTSCVSFLLDQGVGEIVRNLYTRRQPPQGTQARHYSRVTLGRLHEVAALFADPFALLTEGRYGERSSTLGIASLRQVEIGGESVGDPNFADGDRLRQGDGG